MLHHRRPPCPHHGVHVLWEPPGLPHSTAEQRHGVPAVRVIVMVPLNALGYTYILLYTVNKPTYIMYTHMHTYAHTHELTHTHMHIYTHAHNLQNGYLHPHQINPNGHYVPDPVESPCTPSSSAGFPPGMKRPPTTFKLLSFARQIAIGMVRRQALAIPYLSMIFTVIMH